mmetsp:Transcript_32780/g.63236  ORF Transcript_32780/g.63236 Transcript_32780/m.63236 type:complete len:442 (-) Transcript_32780:485-1810(-)
MEAAASGEDFAASTARTSYSEELLKGIDGAPMNTDTERHLVRGLGNQDLLIKQLNGPELEDAPSELFRDSKNSTQPAHPSQVPFLLRFPVTFYGVVIGSTSQGIVWLNISRSPIFWGDWNGSARTIQWCVWAFGVVMLFAISVVYALKIIYWWGAVLRELHHPFRIHFFFGPLLGIMNLCNGAPYDILDRSAEPPERPPLPLVAIVMTATLIVETFVYREWIFSDGLSIRNNNPGYQLSLLPNFSGAVLLANAELESIGHFFWSVGVLFWLLLFISLFQSISKEAPRDADGRRTDIWRFPSTAHPTLFLFIAAPAAAGSSWTALSDHGFDDTSLFFASIALFIAMFMTTNLRLLVQTPFTISWWTYTSTIGSLSVVYTRYAESRPDQDFLRYFSFALSLFSSFMVRQILIAANDKNEQTAKRVINGQKVIHAFRYRFFLCW